MSNQQVQIVPMNIKYIEEVDDKIYVAKYNDGRSTKVEWSDPIDGSRANSMNPSFTGADGGVYTFQVNGGGHDFITNQSYIEYKLKFPFVFDCRNVPKYMTYGQYDQDGVNFQLVRTEWDGTIANNYNYKELLFEFAGGRYQLINGEWKYQIYSYDDDLNRPQMNRKSATQLVAPAAIPEPTDNVVYYINDIHYTSLYQSSKAALCHLCHHNKYFNGNWENTFDSKRHIQFIQGCQNADHKLDSVQGLFQHFGYYKINKYAPQLCYTVSTGPMNAYCVLNETEVNLRGINENRKRVNRFTTIYYQSQLSEDYQKTQPQTWFQHKDPTIECEFEPFIFQKYTEGPMSGKYYKLNILFSDFVRILTGEVYDHPNSTDKVCALTKEYCKDHGIYLQKMTPDPAQYNGAKYSLDSYYSVVVDITKTFQIPLTSLHTIFDIDTLFPLSLHTQPMKIVTRFQPYYYNKIFGSDFRQSQFHFKLYRDEVMPVKLWGDGANKQYGNRSYLGVFNNDQSLFRDGARLNSAVGLIDIRLVLVTKFDQQFQTDLQKSKDVIVKGFIDYDLDNIATNSLVQEVNQQIITAHSSLNNIILDVHPEDVNSEDSLFLHQYSTFKNTFQVLMQLNNYEVCNNETKFFSYYNWDRDGPGDRIYSREINNLNTFRYEAIRSQNMVADYADGGNMNYADMKNFLLKMAHVHLNLEQYGTITNQDAKYDGRDTHNKKMVIKYRIGNYKSNLLNDEPISYGVDQNLIFNKLGDYHMDNLNVSCYQVHDKVLEISTAGNCNWKIVEDIKGEYM